MPTNTYVALLQIPVTVATPSITFSAIPQGYTDLVVVMQPATTHTVGTFPYMRFNSDSGSNYSYTELNGSGTSATSFRDTNQTIAWTSPQLGSISNTLGDNTTIVNIMNYSNSTNNKTYLSRANRAGSTLDYQGVEAAVGLWRNTSAITSVLIGNRRGGVDYNFAVGSTFSLYGIAAASVGAKATGGIISSDSQYFYHTFAASGTFTPTQSISADCLVVAGGGGGNMGANSRAKGGGGGAGGLLFNTISLSNATPYSITVGGGGTGGSGYFGQFTNGGATNGVNSTIIGTGLTTLTAVGGGRGGHLGSNAATGGSGGGSMLSTGQAAGTASQGNAGGLGFAASYTDSDLFNSSGGGGGAGGVGGNAGANNGTGGNGGLGSSDYSAWGSATFTGHNVSGVRFYAGGGGGAGFSVSGTASNGGGGRGGNNSSQANADGVTGTTNTGGGGGGGTATNTYDALGGAGGSGIVIVRYLKA